MDEWIGRTSGAVSRSPCPLASLCPMGMEHNDCKSSVRSDGCSNSCDGTRDDRGCKACGIHRANAKTSSVAPSTNRRALEQGPTIPSAFQCDSQQVYIRQRIRQQQIDFHRHHQHTPGALAASLRQRQARSASSAEAGEQRQSSSLQQTQYPPKSAHVELEQKRQHQQSTLTPVLWDLHWWPRRHQHSSADMAHDKDAEEMTSFLPSGNNVSHIQKTRRSGRGILAVAARRWRSICLIIVALFLGSQLYLWGPTAVGEERMHAWSDKIEQWRPWRPATPPMNDDAASIPHHPPPPPPPGQEHPPPPPPPDAPPAAQPGPPRPIATSASGNPIYLPKVVLPVDYSATITSNEEGLHLDAAQAFPPDVYTFGASKALYNYKDGDPHQGIIPPLQLQLIDRDIARQPPKRPAAVPPYPEGRWVSHSGWSAARNGSKTSYTDALKPDVQEAEKDWRPMPFNSWRPALFDASGSKASSQQLPRVQSAFEAPDKYSGKRRNVARDTLLEKRQRLVRNAFLHAWEAYKKNAWGHDEIRPVTGTANDPFNGWGASIVDALDTLLIMDLPEEYDLCRQHVRDIDFHLVGGPRSAYGGSDGRIPVFETAIRYLGGFLSAHDLSGDEMMRDRAEELAQLILPSFETMTGVPVGRIRLDEPGVHHISSSVILAEAGSMLLEMTRLWQVTGNRTYFDRVHRITDWLQYNMTGSPDRLGVLLPTAIFPERGTMYGWYTWGGMADSTWEYLIKEYQLLGGRLEQYGRFFGDAVDSARKWLIRNINSVPNAPLLILGQSNGQSYTPRLEHLTCFAGGSIGMGARLLRRDHDLDIARRITETCWWAYNSTATGIGPEEMYFYGDKDLDRFETTAGGDGGARRGRARGAPVVGVRSVQTEYKNRPETIESVFYMWRITGDPEWQERGWQMFSSWVTHSIAAYGFSSLSSVLNVPAVQTDSMESFVFAETFKYYYLLFSPPNLVSLDDYVFTTEAHPLLAPKAGVWARPGQGNRKFWDPKKTHVPTSPDAYAGGEMGEVGSLTTVQKSFIYGAWKKEQDNIAKAQANAEAERKAKEKSLLNNEKLANSFRRIISTASAAVEEVYSREVEARNVDENLSGREDISEDDDDDHYDAYLMEARHEDMEEHEE